MNVQQSNMNVTLPAQPTFYKAVSTSNTDVNYTASQQIGTTDMSGTNINVNYSPPPFLSGVPMVPQYRPAEIQPHQAENQSTGASVIQSFVGAATSISNSEFYRIFKFSNTFIFIMNSSILIYDFFNKTIEIDINNFNLSFS